MKSEYPRFKFLYSHEELREHFSLASVERQFIKRFRGRANRYTAAVMLKALPYLGYLPKSLQHVPAEVRVFIGSQLGYAQDVSHDYRWDSSTRERHWVKIRSFTGWRSATTRDKQELEGWLRQEGVISAPTSEKLFELASHRLRQLRVEVPAESELRRLVAAALNGYFQDLHRRIANGLSREVCGKLDHLLVVPSGESLSTFEKLKLEPGKPGVKTLQTEINKLNELRRLSVPRAALTGAPWRVLEILKRRAANEKASRMRAHLEFARHALLATFVHVRTAEVTDNVLRTLNETVQKLDRASDRQVNRALLKDSARVEWKLDLLGQIAEASVAKPESTIRESIFPLAGEQILRELAAEHRASGPQFRLLRQELMHRKFVRHYRRMLPAIIGNLGFQSDSRYQPVIKALDAIRQTASQHGRHFKEAVPLRGIVSRGWQKHGIDDADGDKKVDRRYYELCVLHKLQRALKCKEVWVDGSLAYRNPNEDMPADWSNPQRRMAHYHKLGKPLEARAFAETLRNRLSAALQSFDRQLLQLPHLRIRSGDPKTPGHGLFALDKLSPQKEPTSLALIKDGISRRYGMLELLDVFAEADRLADFTRFFIHSGTKQMRSREKLRPLLLLGLFAEGTNLGIKRVVNASGGYAYEELLYVRKNYLSPEAIRNANIAVVNKILEIRNPRLWGEGHACASDGKRFESWSQNLITEWRTRYRGAGVLAYWHVETNAVCIYSQLRSFSNSEVAAMIEGLIRHDTEMRVEKNFVDSHGQSEIAFAFCHLLGTVRLMPRLKRIKYERLYFPGK
ncbi:MAG: Tn3 family transposase, partial [Terriglobia bacterium]